ncbi:MAG: DUF4097 family beta strand repeat-containing protein [Clostridia bacterium]|nr:DUF4097 family beta strand repeat-containing protein [Clostridia bacterium]
MRKATKVWLITATSLVLIGGILFVGVMTTLKWDFSKLSTVRYETNTHEIVEPFGDISLMTGTADIMFALSDDGKCRVVCYEEENAKHSVTVEEDTLVIKLIDTKSWYDYIGLRLGSPKITVYLPKTEYNALSIHESTGNVEIPKDFEFANADISLSTGAAVFCASASETIKIKTTTGNIRVEDTSAGSVDLTVSTGKVTVSGVNCKGDITVGVSTGKASLTDISCKSVISNGTTGSITLSHVIAANKFSIERSTGDVKFNRCDAAELYVKTSTGNVIGSLLTDKVFITDTNTGSVDVPKTAVGGRCEVKTVTGNIKIEIE